MKRVLSYCLLFALLFTLLTVPAQAIDSERNTQLEEMDSLGSAGNYSGCIALADTILSEDASFMEAYRYKSMCYFYLGDFQKAYDTLEAQLQLNPLNQVALYNAASAASLAGLEEKALDLIETLVQLDTLEKYYIETDASFDSLRSNPRYEKLMEISIVVGGKLLELDVPPIITEDRALLPLRAAFEALGADIEWDAATKTVSCVYGDIAMQITIDDNIAVINGDAVEMDVPATIVDGRTLVPVRFVSEALEATVDWNAYSRTVFVNTTAPDGKDVIASHQETLTNGTTVLAVDGAYISPYFFDGSEGCLYIVADSEAVFKAMNALNSDDRYQYLTDTAFEYYSFVYECDTVHIYFVYDGKIYYEGHLGYDDSGMVVMPEYIYYENGKLSNIVKQYIDGLNYKDYYTLPADQRTSTTLDD